MDNAELIEQVTLTLDQQVEVAHNLGLSYWQILRILLSTNLGVMMKADAEFWQKIEKER